MKTVLVLGWTEENWRSLWGTEAQVPGRFRTIKQRGTESGWCIPTLPLRTLEFLGYSVGIYGRPWQANIVGARDCRSKQTMPLAPQSLCSAEESDEGTWVFAVMA